MMSIPSRREYALELSARYRVASRPEKGRILDEFVATSKYGRKYALTLLNHPPTARTTPVKRPRATVYGQDVQRALPLVWEASGRLCAKRLVPFLEELLNAIQRHKEIDLPQATREKLLRMSAATADRILTPVRRKLGWRGITTTKPGTLLRNEIRVRTSHGWDEDVPGYFEADLVAHCGSCAAGSFLYTLVLTDIATEWTECQALLNKSQNTVTQAVERIRKQLPFPIKGIDSDNGSEFINANLKRYCEVNHIEFTRSRPYKKNDQCHVEQKNWSIVRQQVGYDRYEGQEECKQLANLYRYLRCHVNYFQPSMKLLDKHREGAKIVKRYTKAQTPRQRLLDYKVLKSQTINDHEEFYQGLNPVQLLREVQTALDKLQELTKVRFANEATNTR